MAWQPAHSSWHPSWFPHAPLLIHWSLWARDQEVSPSACSLVLSPAHPTRCSIHIMVISHFCHHGHHGHWLYIYIIIPPNREINWGTDWHAQRHPESKWQNQNLHPGIQFASSFLKSLQVYSTLLHFPNLLSPHNSASQTLVCFRVIWRICQNTDPEPHTQVFDSEDLEWGLRS